MSPGKFPKPATHITVHHIIKDTEQWLWKQKLTSSLGTHYPFPKMKQATNLNEREHKMK